MTMNNSLRIKYLENLNSQNSNAKAATGALKGVPVNQGQNSTENVAATANPHRTKNKAIAYPQRTKLAKPKVQSNLKKGRQTRELAQKPYNIGRGF